MERMDQLLRKFNRLMMNIYVGHYIQPYLMVRGICKDTYNMTMTAANLFNRF